jgi:hypothetical protein
VERAAASSATDRILGSLRLRPGLGLGTSAFKPNLFGRKE